VLEEGEAFERTQSASAEAVQEQADGMGGQLGLDAGAQAWDSLGAVALDPELLRQLAVEGLDSLAEVGDQRGAVRVVQRALVGTRRSEQVQVIPVPKELSWLKTPSA
jgi:hypothetical protein